MNQTFHKLILGRLQELVRFFQSQKLRATGNLNNVFMRNVLFPAKRKFNFTRIPLNTLQFTNLNSVIIFNELAYRQFVF